MDCRDVGTFFLLYTLVGVLLPPIPSLPGYFAVSTLVV
jgi:hypothetical protein